MPQELLIEKLSDDNSIYGYIKRLGLWCLDKYHRLPFQLIINHVDLGIGCYVHITPIEATVPIFMKNYVDDFDKEQV